MEEVACHVPLQASMSSLLAQRNELWSLLHTARCAGYAEHSQRTGGAECCYAAHQQARSYTQWLSHLGNTLIEHGSLYYFLKKDFSFITMCYQSFQRQSLQVHIRPRPLKKKKTFIGRDQYHMLFVIPVHFDISSQSHNCVQVTSKHASDQDHSILLTDYEDAQPIPKE